MRVNKGCMGRGGRMRMGGIEGDEEVKSGRDVSGVEEK